MQWTVTECTLSASQSLEFIINSNIILSASQKKAGMGFWWKNGVNVLIVFSCTFAYLQYNCQLGIMFQISTATDVGPIAINYCNKYFKSLKNNWIFCCFFSTHFQQFVYQCGVCECGCNTNTYTYNHPILPVMSRVRHGIYFFQLR